jgi:hypothetical protein
MERNSKGQFLKGNIPHNKGKKQSEWLSPEQVEKLKATYINKQSPTSPLSIEEGRYLPFNAKRKGTVVKRTHIHRKGKNVGKEETEYFINIDWRGNRKPNNLYKRYVWEVYHQQDVPEGYVVYIKNQKPDDIRPENLEIITRKELLLRNSAGR